MKQAYKSNNNIVYSCKYHIIWCPKYRRKVLTGPVEIRLKELIRDICKEKKIDLIEMEIMPDHIHLLLEIEPRFGVMDAIRILKGRTSFCLRQEFPTLRSSLPSLWTSNCFISTVGGASLDVVKDI